MPKTPRADLTAQSAPAASGSATGAAGATGRVTLARILGAVGLRGEVRLVCFTRDPDDLKRHDSLEAGGRCLHLLGLRRRSSGLVARFAEITDRASAEALRGMVLDVARDALPAPDDGEYYYCDLIGRRCISPAGDEVGVIIGVENYGAGDILDIRRPDGRTFMVPFNPAAVPDMGDACVIAPEYLP